MPAQSPAGRPGGDPAAQALPPSLVAPSLPRRMACWMYEGILLFAVVFIAGWLFSTLGQMRDPMDARRPVLQVFLLVIFGIYFTWFWAKGQTLAMKTWHIRLVDRAGRPVSQARALLRYAWSWLWFLPSVLLAAALNARPAEAAVLMVGWVVAWAMLSRFHPQRQFWHDALAGTRLVSAPPRTR